MHKIINKHFDWIDIIICCLTVIAFLFILKMPMKVNTFGDGYFHGEVKIMSRVIRGEANFNQIKITKAPGPDFFYLIPYCFVPTTASERTFWMAGIIWTGIFMILSMMMLRRTARNLFSDKEGIIVVALCFLIPLHIYYSSGILAEGLAYISVICMLYGWSTWKKNSYIGIFRSKNWWLMVLGMLFFVLARPNGLLIVPLLVLLLIIPKRYTNFTNKLARNGAWASLIVFISLFSIVTLIVKSFPVPKGDFDQNDYFVLVFQASRFQFRNEPFDWRYFGNPKKLRPDSKDYQDQNKNLYMLYQLMDSTHRSYNDVFFSWSINDMFNNIPITIRQIFIKAIYGHSLSINSVQEFKFHIGPLSGKILFNILQIFLNIINFILILFSIIWMFRNKSILIESWPIFIIWLSLVIFHSLIYVEPRYFFPARPAIMLLASPFVVTLVDKFFPNFFRNSAKLTNTNFI